MIAVSGHECATVPLTSVLTREGALLRFTTAGSVDDGKSTLIGRLLYDTRAVYEDQLTSIVKSGINRSDGPIDLSLLTDGLRAEREQGITIDVAYRYFSTPRRRFIFADTPGHEQYTRNMVTGASTAQAAIVLIDATKGLLPQSRRHTYIASLLGIEHVIAAVNKMDLVDYREEVFQAIARDFRLLAERLGIPNIFAIPVSALRGDNVVNSGYHMPWYTGPTLLEHLETIPADTPHHAGPLRLPVQYVIRPDARFRGFSGRIASGTLRRGDNVLAFPSGIRSRVKSITTFDGELDEAGPGASITLTLQDEIDVGRGDLFTGSVDPPQSSTSFIANLVWMSPDPSRRQEIYLLKHATRTVRARLQKVLHRVDINTLEYLPVEELEMNDIAQVNVETTQPLFFDPYRKNRTTGSFILIDPITNATVAGGMIEGALQALCSQPTPTSSRERTEPTRRSTAIWIVDRPSLAQTITLAARRAGYSVEQVSVTEFSPEQLVAVVTVLKRMGITPVLHASCPSVELKHRVTSIFESTAVFDADLPLDDAAAISRALEWLRHSCTQEPQ